VDALAPNYRNYRKNMGGVGELFTYTHHRTKPEIALATTPKAKPSHSLRRRLVLLLRPDRTRGYRSFGVGLCTAALYNLGPKLTIQLWKPKLTLKASRTAVTRRTGLTCALLGPQ
jgi:hypothetical protein